MIPTNTIRTVLLALGVVAAAHAADDACNVLFNADRKMILTAHHSYQTEILPAHKEPRASETIYSGGVSGAVYIMVGGKWQRSAMSPEAALKQKEENIRDTQASCRYVRDEAVNGELTAMYTIHTETEDNKSDGTVWVSKSNGMPVREEMDFDVSPAKMHLAVRYDYSNVRPPEGVK